MNGSPDYYLCPFCVTSWICDGPHIEQKDLPSYYEKIRIIQEDLGELAAELVIANPDMAASDLAKLLELEIKNRKPI